MLCTYKVLVQVRLSPSIIFKILKLIKFITKNFYKVKIHLVELVDTSDLKSDSKIKNIGSSPIMNIIYFCS